MTNKVEKLDPRLLFEMALPSGSCNRFIKGSLFLKDNPDKAGLKLEASSGCVSYQYWASWTQKGRGEMPPNTAIKLDTYTVSTQKLWLPHVRGVEGSFYAISPFQVRVNGSHRGDFGVHFDANVRGSAGCIVLPEQDHWDSWRTRIEYWRSEGFQQIPLVVNYVRE